MEEPLNENQEPCTANVMPRFVYRLDERGKCRTYEIGENDNPRTSPKEWCDRRICEGFWGDEKMAKHVVSLLNEGKGVSDWEEDFAHENGNYMNKCGNCGVMFKGHKRRVRCKSCG